MASPRKNTPSYKRVASPPSMRLMPRDRAVLVSVYQYRVLTSHQIEALHFAGGNGKRSLRSACQRRLQLLFQHKLLDRVIRPLIPGEGREAFAYTVARQGADIVAETLGIDRAGIGWRPKESRMGPLFLDHLLMINTMRATVQLLTQQGIWPSSNWIDELTLKSDYQDKVPAQQRRGSKKRIFPDGYFAIRRTGHEQPAHFFLEVDRATESNKRWMAKVSAYNTFRRSGDSVTHFGTRNFRILTLVSTARRLENLRSATVKAGGGGYFWFTTAAEISIWEPEELLKPIWLIAGEEEKRSLF